MRPRVSTPIPQTNYRQSPITFASVAAFDTPQHVVVVNVVATNVKSQDCVFFAFCSSYIKATRTRTPQQSWAWGVFLFFFFWAFCSYISHHIYDIRRAPTPQQSESLLWLIDFSLFPFAFFKTDIKLSLNARERGAEGNTSKGNGKQRNTTHDIRRIMRRMVMCGWSAHAPTSRSFAFIFSFGIPIAHRAPSRHTAIAHLIRKHAPARPKPSVRS